MEAIATLPVFWGEAVSGTLTTSCACSFPVLVAHPAMHADTATGISPYPVFMTITSCRNGRP
jgi:hypothetical protein